MKKFGYNEASQMLLKPEIYQLLCYIHEQKGRLGVLPSERTSELGKLMEVAKIQSTGASNRIEGVRTSHKRLTDLVTGKTEPRNRSEEEISGYREVLSLIHESHKYISITPSVILQFHKILYSYSGCGRGGHWKNSDNVIEESDLEGRRRVRFTPTPAFLTGQAMNDLCSAFSHAWEEDLVDRLLLIPMFILDFLCIHPFNDGNGRMSRLLSLLLFYKAGFNVGKYISLESLIENTKEEYYASLRDSSEGWHENANSYIPFTIYLLGIVAKAFRELDLRMGLMYGAGMSKSDAVKAVFDQNLGALSKRQIMDLVPSASMVTVERALSTLLKEGYIRKIGAGPATTYFKEKQE